MFQTRLVGGVAKKRMVVCGLGWWCSDSQDGDVGADPNIISNGNWLADAHSGLSSVKAERVWTEKITLLAMPSIPIGLHLQHCVRQESFIHGAGNAPRLTGTELTEPTTPPTHPRKGVVRRASSRVDGS